MHVYPTNSQGHDDLLNADNDTGMNSDIQANIGQPRGLAMIPPDMMLVPMEAGLIGMFLMTMDDDQWTGLVSIQ